MLDVGPTGYAKFGMSTTASPGGLQLSIVKSETSNKRLPDMCFELDALLCAIELTAMTGKFRAFAPIAISIGRMFVPELENTIMQSCGPKVKLRRITSAYPETFSRKSA